MKHHLSCLWDIDSNTIFFFEEVDIFVYNPQQNNFLLQKDKKKWGNGGKFYKSFNDFESVFSLGSSNEKKRMSCTYFLYKNEISQFAHSWSIYLAFSILKNNIYACNTYYIYNYMIYKDTLFQILTVASRFNAHI